jgi:hypothetical protein
MKLVIAASSIMHIIRVVSSKIKEEGSLGSQTGVYANFSLYNFWSRDYARTFLLNFLKHLYGRFLKKLSMVRAL